MPARKIAARGGAVKIRTIRLPDGRYANVYVVRKAGPRGGHTILGEPKKSKSPSSKRKR